MGHGSSDKEAITIRLTKRQLELLEQVDDVYGNNRGEKIRTILACWLGADLEDRIRGDAPTLEDEQ